MVIIQRTVTEAKTTKVATFTGDDIEAVVRAWLREHHGEEWDKAEIKWDFSVQGHSAFIERAKVICQVPTEKDGG